MRDRQQAIDVDGDALVELKLLLEALAAEPEGTTRARRQLLEMRDRGGNRLGRFGRGVGEVAEDVQVVERGERPRQIGFDEPLGAAQAFESDFDEDPSRILDVVARRLHQARHLVQLRDHPARALGQRRVVEQNLSGQAGREQIAVQLRITVPGAHRLELEKTRPDRRVERRPLGPLDLGQSRRVDRRQTTGKAGKITDLRVHRRPAQVLEQVVVEVDSVEGRVGRMRFVEPGQELVHEVG